MGPERGRSGPTCQRQPRGAHGSVTLGEGEGRTGVTTTLKMQLRRLF